MSGEQWGEAVERVLTPIPAEHRKVYYDALLAGRDEAQRRGYHMLDDRIFAAFHRALYRPMVELIVADTRRQDREALIRVLFHHHRKTRTDDDGIAGRCVCGWGRPGDAFPLHIADELDAAIARGSGNGGTA